MIPLTHDDFTDMSCGSWMYNPLQGRKAKKTTCASLTPKEDMLISLPRMVFPSWLLGTSPNPHACTTHHRSGKTCEGKRGVRKKASFGGMR